MIRNRLEDALSQNIEKAQHFNIFLNIVTNSPFTRRIIQSFPFCDIKFLYAPPRINITSNKNKNNDNNDKNDKNNNNNDNFNNNLLKQNTK